MREVTVYDAMVSVDIQTDLDKEVSPTAYQLCDRKESALPSLKFLLC